MAQEIKELIARIQKEGVDAAEKQSAQIKAEAESAAKKIIAEAKAEAEKIIERALRMPKNGGFHQVIFKAGRQGFAHWLKERGRLYAG